MIPALHAVGLDIPWGLFQLYGTDSILTGKGSLQLQAHTESEADYSHQFRAWKMEGNKVCRDTGCYSKCDS